MATETKEVKLFDNVTAELAYDKNALKGVIGTQARDIADVDVTAGPSSLPILGRRIALNNKLNAGISVLDANTTQLFNQKLNLPEGQVPVAIAFGANFGVSFEGSVPTGSALWSMSMSTSTQAAFGYRRIVPAASDSKVLDVVKDDLIHNIMLPNYLDLRSLNNEAHELSATADFKLSADLATKTFETTFQYEASVIGKIFDGVSIEASANASMSASVGFGYYGKVLLTVSDMGVEPQGWVRVRVEREQKKKLSFGATLAISVSENLGSSLTQILDNILQLEPVQDGLNYLSEISTELQKIGDGDWSTIEDKLSEEATDFAFSSLKIDDLLSSTQVADAVTKINTFLDAYNNLDSRLSSLWNQLLENVNLDQEGNIRQTLEQITEINLDDVDSAIASILDPKFAKALKLLESITDLSLEKLLTNSGILDVLKKAQDVATKALTFIEDTPSDVVNAIQDWVKKKGIAGYITWLQDNATSVDQLKTTARASAKNAIERLLGKALDQIDDDDLDKVQNWAAKVAEAISPAKISQFETKLKNNLEKLDADLNASLSLTIDRETRQSQMVDITLNPKNGDVRDAFEALRAFKVFEFMAKLPEQPPQESPDDIEPLPYLIHGALFTNTSIKTEIWSIFMSGFLSFNKKVTRRRLTESRLTVEDNKLQGTYTGTYFQEAMIQNDVTWNAAFSLEAKVQGRGLDITKPFKPKPAYSFNLTMIRSDQSTKLSELLASIDFLNDVGFNIPRNIVNQIPQGVETSLVVNARFDAAAVTEFFSRDINRWNEAKMNPKTESNFLPAANRWLNTGLVDKEMVGFPAGQILAAVIKSSRYLDFWPKNAMELNKSTRGGWDVVYKGQEKFLTKGNLLPTIFLKRRSTSAPKQFADVRKTLKGFRGSLTNTALFKAMEQFADACRHASPNAWDNPLFAYWLVESRLSRAGQELAAKQGIATLRYKEGGQWKQTFTFTIPSV